MARIKLTLPITTLAVAFVWPFSPVRANEPPHCLSPQERREVIANKQAIPLGRAVNAVRRKVPGDVVRAQLCRSDRGLVYMLTVLSRSGRVTRATLDASSARLLERR